MNTPHSMIREWSSFQKSNIVVESRLNELNGNKDCYMKGIFIQAEQRNLNERVYPLNEITNAVMTLNERIKRGGSVLGECDHPDTLTVNLDNVSHMITEMFMQGADGIGTLKLLPTPKGQIIRSMIESGVKLGVSSRGSGNVDHRGHVSDFEIITVDIVAQPSAPDAYPTPIFESLYKTCGHRLVENMQDMANDVLHGSMKQEIALSEEIHRFFKQLRAD